ncbi:hypothetical protein BJ170DRAFT_483076 [Xylariales sp. AK1849]|nr:hypothetical protein BJ170DRAFT_483076 [Xylariales sp. AK1849]
MQLNIAHLDPELALRAAPNRPAKKMAAKRPRQKVSQPVDAEDLRRRLFVVITEQTALQERRRQVRREAAAKKASDEQRPTAQHQDVSNASEVPRSVPVLDAKSFAVRAAAANSDIIKASATTTSVKSPEPERTRTSLGAKDDESGRKTSKATSLAGTKEPYRHVPQQAASQFALTATANVLRHKNLTHSLSHRALKFHIEGSASEKAELGSSTTPAAQQRALRKSQSEREILHERNQFQYSRIMEESLENDATGRSRHRHTSTNSTSNQIVKCISMGAIQEELVMRPAAAVVSLDEVILEDPVVLVDLAVANEHRVDWTQSDESQEKRKGLRSPVQRTVDSIRMLTWLNINKQSRNSVLSEKIEAAALKSPRSGFFGKFRRQEAAAHA